MRTGNVVAAVVWSILSMAQAALAQPAPQGVQLADAGTWGVNPGYDFYLYSVAISSDGATAVIGGRSIGPEDGSARVFTRSGTEWSRQESIPIGSDAVQTFGGLYSADISADGATAIVGGPLDDSERGAAWIFTRSGDGWLQWGDKLIGQGLDSSYWQGLSVAISADGRSAVVGGPVANGTGAAWVFTQADGAWTQQGGPLIGSGITCDSCFQGWSVDISGDGNTVILGAPFAGVRSYTGGATGAAFVFTRSGGVWSQQALLVGSGAGGNEACQGYSVAIAADGNTAVVGGPQDASGRGAAWVFVRHHDGVWSQQGPKLKGGSSGHGYSVAISPEGEAIVVGAPWEDAARVFSRSLETWTQVGDILSQYTRDGYQGAAVAIAAYGTTTLVGAPGDGGGGSAWVYSFPGGALPSLWVPVAARSDGSNLSQWRTDLGLLNAGASTAVVQLRFHGSGGVVSGSTYVPAGAQAILEDVVGQLGAAGQGALEIIGDPELRVTVRTYDRSASIGDCHESGTRGQTYPVITAGDGLETGESSLLPSLVENAEYRTNIGLVNIGGAESVVRVELFDGAGTKLTQYQVRLAPGQWAQRNQPFRTLAGQTALDRGYARVTVLSGSGVFALASVVDNASNDPTAVAMQR